MILFNKSAEITAYIKRLQDRGKKIGFVPTMGALHEGHLSLVEASRNSNDHTVCSIFINPTQFNDPKDFTKYPVTIEKDIEFLVNAETDMLFLPGVHEVYPDGTGDLKQYDLGYLENILEGKYRPGHFQGVCQVMRRLLEIIHPDNLFMGQKDYQQCMVVKKLLEIMHSDTVLHTCPTLREPEGLAMSSRNQRLNPEERKRALAISGVLQNLKNGLKKGNLQHLLGAGLSTLQKSDFKVDYLEIADAETLEPVIHWDGRQKLVVLAAAFLNEVRLIDNMIIAS
jgi:pantoate--beta-alanine ligase